MAKHPRGALTVEIVGLKELQWQLAALPPVVQEKLLSMLRAVCDAGQTRARQVVPVRTGALRNAITVIGRDLDWRLSVEGAPRRYAPMVEYGTKHVSAYHFMRAGRDVMRAGLKAGTGVLARQLPRLARAA